MRDYLSNRAYLSFISKREATARKDKSRAEQRNMKGITESVLSGTREPAVDTSKLIEDFMADNQGDAEKVQYITKKERKL